MHRTLFALVVAAGCGGSTPAATTSPTPVQGPMDRHVFHLEGVADTVNLELDDTGDTFRWGVDGCDYNGGSRGDFAREGEHLVITGEFTWMGVHTFTAEPERVVLTPQADGSLRAEFVDGVIHEDGTGSDETIVQTWSPGATCSACGGTGPMPSGHDACDHPYLGD